MADQTPEEKAAAEAAAALLAATDTVAVAKAAQDQLDAAAAVAKAAESAKAAKVTPLALNIAKANLQAKPPIALGERRSFRPKHGRMQNPVTLEWFLDKAVKTTVDAWIMTQYYAEEPRLVLDEE